MIVKVSHGKFIGFDSNPRHGSVRWREDERGNAGCTVGFSLVGDEQRLLVALAGATIYFEGFRKGIIHKTFFGISPEGRDEDDFIEGVGLVKVDADPGAVVFMGIDGGAIADTANAGAQTEVGEFMELLVDLVQLAFEATFRSIL